MTPISVVIPAYNAEAVLDRAIVSALAQTERPAEIVVVDDGSTDATGRLAARHGPPVRCVRQDNRGVAAARNRGVAEATSPWIAFLDADDEWLPHKLAHQWEIFQRWPELRWGWCAMETVGDVRRPGPLAVWRRAPARRRTGASAHGGPRPFFPAALEGVPFQTSGFLVHRSVFDEVGVFDAGLRVAEDRDMWWRIALAHPAGGYCPDVCYRWYVDTPGSLTKIGSDRSASLGVVCENLRRARQRGPDVARAVEVYARRLAAGYRLRLASGEIAIGPRVLAEADAVLRPTSYERLCAGVVRRLPPRLGRAVAGAVLALSETARRVRRMARRASCAALQGAVQAGRSASAKRCEGRPSAAARSAPAPAKDA